MWHSCLTRELLCQETFLCPLHMLYTKIQSQRTNDICRKLSLQIASFVLMQALQNIIKHTQLIVFHSTKAQKNLSPFYFQQSTVAKQTSKNTCATKVLNCPPWCSTLTGTGAFCMISLSPLMTLGYLPTILLSLSISPLHISKHGIVLLTTTIL